MKDFKIGDTVKVLREAKDKEMGWDNAWMPEMDDYINNTFIVLDDCGDAGFELQLNSRSYRFPWYVLEKVPSEKPSEVDKLLEGTNFGAYENSVRLVMERLLKEKINVKD